MMRERVLAFLRAQGVQAGAKMIVGLSGGADSVCLLHVLQSLDALPLHLTAVHVNHGLRGEEAARDERFCRQFCETLGVEFCSVHVNVPAESAKTGEGHEACGRRLRYAVFRKAAGEDGYILTAHTADDNAETVLMHLLRGTGLSGLGGIPPVRGNILRPLLSCTRADVERYCAKHDLSYMTDSTNEDGTPYFHKVISEYDKNAYVLMHYFNDRNETANNLRPLATSVVDVKYYLRLHNGTAADSSYLSTTPADSVVRFDLGGSLIDGYRVALMDMHVGDSVDVIVPFQSGYGVMGKGTVLPYSNLKFSIKLVDIYEYENQ